MFFLPFLYPRRWLRICCVNARLYATDRKGQPVIQNLHWRT